MYRTEKISTGGVSRAAFGCIDGVQTVDEPADRVVGIAAALLIVCRQKGLNVSEVMNQADRVVHDGCTAFVKPQMAAVYDYARSEL